jgi:hypothetical protein
MESWVENIIISTFVRLLRFDGQHRSAHAGGGGFKGEATANVFQFYIR